MLRSRASTAATTTPQRPRWSAAANGCASWTRANGSASRATAKPTSWTAVRSTERPTFRAECKGSMARNAARCPPKFPAQCPALDADDSGAAQPYASTRECATADSYARRRRGGSRLRSSAKFTGARPVRIAVHPGTSKSRTIASATNRNGAAEGDTRAYSAVKKRIPDRRAQQRLWVQTGAFCKLWKITPGLGAAGALGNSPEKISAGSK